MSYLQNFLSKTSGLIFAALIVAIIGFNSTTKANGNISITRAEPDPVSKNNTWFIFEAQPGETVSDTVLIKNLSSNPTTVRINIIDSKSNKAGRFILKRNDEPQFTIGKWSELEKNIIELGPNQSLPLTFNITIPVETEPGEFSGGIVAEEVIEATSGSSITTRIGNRIYLKVPGKFNPQLDWLGFSKQLNSFDLTSPFRKNHYFQFTLQNNGNTVIRPIVTIDIYNIFDQKVETITKNLGEFQPGHTSEPLIKWEKAPFVGRYHAKATIDLTADLKELPPDQQQKIIKEIPLTIIPWELFIIAFLLIMIVTLIVLTIRAKKRIIENTQAHP